MVAVFPEGLPASITIAQALAVERLTKNSVIVKKLSSVETLGNVDYICTDKTGTITQHTMTVKEIFIKDTFYSSAEIFKLMAETESKELADIFVTAITASTAELQEQDGNIIQEIGDPTEIAMIKSAYLNGYKPELLVKTHTVIERLPFSSENMFSAAIVKAGNTQEILIKGAPDKILTFCGREDLSKKLSDKSAQGFRLIGFAKVACSTSCTNLGEAIKNLTNATFLGCTVIYDPPKDEVKQVIQTAHAAHISIAMITGDSQKTGQAIAESVGIDKVYSRVTPMEKLEIVASLKAQGHIVAMTGDGVNDAPALKKADVGIAMGRAGTQVAQEAAAIILTDDNFSTIVYAIREGRTVYQNLKKLIIYLITNNLGKVVAIVSLPLFGLPVPLLPLQILWSNVIMESLPSIALSIEPASAEIMKQSPVKLSEPIIQKQDRKQMIIDGFLFGFSIALGYMLTKQFTGEHVVAQTAAFIITLLSPQLYAFAIREGNLWQKLTRPNPLLHGFFLLTLIMMWAIVYVPWFNIAFGTAPIGNYFVMWTVLGLSLTTPVLRIILSK